MQAHLPQRLTHFRYMAKTEKLPAKYSQNGKINGASG